jgi:hypothetical protein
MCYFFVVAKATKECISKASLLKNLPACAAVAAGRTFAKEGNTPLNPLLIEGKHTSLWQREVRRDFI